MLQTLLWSRMTCFSTFLKYPLAVLAQTPVAYILMYCNAFPTTFTAVRCFQLRIKVLRLDATSYHSSDRTGSTLVYDYKISTSGSSARNSHLTQGGRTTMMTMPVNRITSQCKIKLSQKYCPWINLQLWNFCHPWFLQWMDIFFLIIMFCSTCLYRSVHRHRGSCSFSGHKQRCWTVLSKIRYKVQGHPTTIFGKISVRKTVWDLEFSEHLL